MQDPKEYFQSRPKKSMGSGCIFFNKKGEILIVKPSYRDYWSLPGGGVDEKESPMSACIREVKEEIGLEITHPKFICVDYGSCGEIRGDDLQFLFSGGILNNKEISKIKLLDGELTDFKFVSHKKAFSMIGGRLKKRLPVAIKVFKSKKSAYLEDSNLT